MKNRGKAWESGMQRAARVDYFHSAFMNQAETERKRQLRFLEKEDAIKSK